MHFRRDFSVSARLPRRARRILNSMACLIVVSFSLVKCAESSWTFPSGNEIRVKFLPPWSRFIIAGELGTNSNHPTEWNDISLKLCSFNQVMTIRNMEDLEGHVSILSEDSALEFCRLWTEIYLSNIVRSRVNSPIGEHLEDILPRTYLSKQSALATHGTDYRSYLNPCIGNFGRLPKSELEKVNWRSPSVKPVLGGFIVRRILWTNRCSRIASCLSPEGSLIESREFVGWNGAYRFSVERERAMPRLRGRFLGRKPRCFDGD